MFARIRSKLLVAFLAVTLIPVSALVFYSYTTAEAALRQSAIRGETEAVHLAALRVENVLRVAATTVYFQAGEPNFRDRVRVVLAGTNLQTGTATAAARGARDKLEADLEFLVGFFRDWRRASILGPRGEELVRVETDREGKTIPVRDNLGAYKDHMIFRGPMDTHRRQPHLWPWRDWDDRLQLTISVRIPDPVQRGRVLGVFAADIPIDDLIGVSPPQTPPEDRVRAVLLDAYRRPIAAINDEIILNDIPDWEGQAGGERTTDAPVAFETDRGTFYSLAPLDSPGHRIGESVMEKWYLLRETPDGQTFEAISEFQKVFQGILVGTLLGALLLGSLLARHIAKPLQELKEGAQTIGAGSLDHAIVPRSQDEVGQVATEFNRMAKRLKEVHDGLEQTLDERTAELRVANQKLHDDLEERKRLEAHLIQSEKLSSIGLLASSVAHEINNPMGIIAMNVQLAIEKAQRGEVDLKKLTAIMTQSERIAGITRNLLDVARPQTRDFSLLDVRNVVRSTMDLVSVRFTRSGVDASLEMADDVPLIQGDAGQLAQVFLNLALNAEQAMTRGGRLDVTVRKNDSGGVEVTFADDGPGIEPSNMEHLFEPFFTTKGGKGTGLGLAVSSGIVKAHGGRLEVESTPGEGAIFRVTLGDQAA